MVFTNAASFSVLFFLQLAVTDGRGTPAQNQVGASNMSTNWRKLVPPSDIAVNVGFVQYVIDTDSFKGAGVFTPGGDSRQPVFRLNMDFWSRMKDPEQETRYIGPLGQIHRDFERYGSPEFWRDVYPSTGSGSVQGIDTDQTPVFFQENIEGIMQHWSISIALLAGVQ